MHPFRPTLNHKMFGDGNDLYHCWAPNVPSLEYKMFGDEENICDHLSTHLGPTWNNKCLVRWRNLCHLDINWAQRIISV